MSRREPLDLFAPPEAKPVPEPPKSRRRAVLQAPHWITFAIIWVAFAIIDTLAIRDGLDNIREKPVRVLFTPLAALSGPFVGSYSRGFGQGCCTDFAFRILPYAAIPALAGITLQWLWRPQKLAARVLRIVLWSGGWILWFGSSLPSLVHALM